nr:immunoglobulin heavy chain junction region [Mus musculus]
SVQEGITTVVALLTT